MKLAQQLRGSQNQVCLMTIHFFLAISAHACELTMASDPLYFEDSIAPILRKNCTACHNSKLAEGGLKLETQSDLARGGDSGPTFDVLEIDTSLLIARSTSVVDDRMPPADNKVGAEPLTQDQIAKVKAWIAGGAMSRGTTHNMTDYANLRLPEGARGSYGVAISPDSSFVAFGRGGQLVIHNSQALSALSPVGSLDGEPMQVIVNAHPDFIHSIAISPDGQRIATGSTGQVKVWKRSAASIDESRTLLAAEGIDSKKLLCSSSDGKWFATVELSPAAPNESGDSIVKVEPMSVIKVLMKNGVQSHSFSVADSSVSLGVFSPSNQRLFAIGNSNSFFCWDVSGKNAMQLFTTPLPSLASSIDVLDDLTVVLTMDRKVTVWKMNASNKFESADNHSLAAAVNADGPVDTVRISPDRTLACTLANDPTTGTSSLKLWNIAQSKLVGTIARDRKMQLITLNSDRELRRTQATLERAKAMVVENEKSLEAEVAAVKAAQANKEKAAQSSATKENEKMSVVQGLADHEKLIAETKAAIETATQKLAQLTTELEPKKKSLAEVEKQSTETKAALENADKALLGIQENEKAATLKLEGQKQKVLSQGELLAAIQTKNAAQKAENESTRFSVKSIAFANSRVIAAANVPSASNANAIDLFSTESLERTDSYPAAKPIENEAELSPVALMLQSNWRQETLLDAASIVVDRATAIAFSSDGKTLAIGSGLASRSGQLSIINTLDGTLTKTIPDLHSDSILGLAYSPDGRWLASGGADKMTNLLNTESYEIAMLFEGHTHHVLAMGWQEDGNRLATASSDATVKLWDIEKGESIRTITGFGAEVTSIAFIGSTPNTVSSTLNNLVRMHDSNSGKQSKQFGPVADSLYSVVASPNGKYAIATGQDGIVHVWKVEDGTLVVEWK